MSTLDPWLLSDETGEPFSHCIHCRMPLLELDRPWLVNKDFHQGECTLEYAICEACRDAVSRELSEESKLAVQRFLEVEIPWDERISAFIAEPDLRYDNCIACNCPREVADGYASSVLLDASGNVEFGPLPLLICSDCMGLMTEKLSQATRDTWQRFLDDHFDCPPQLSSLPGLF